MSAIGEDIEGLVQHEQADNSNSVNGDTTSNSTNRQIPEATDEAAQTSVRTASALVFEDYSTCLGSE